MGTHQFTEYLGDEPNKPKQMLKEKVGEHDRDGLITSDEQKWDAPVNARYGGDELWASKALGAGTDIVNEELWDGPQADGLRVTPLPDGYKP